MRGLLSIASFFLCVSLSATDYRPWSFENDLELYPRLDYAFQHYSRVATGSSSQNKIGNAHFVTGAIGASYTVYSGEVEAVFAATSHRSFGFDHLRLTGRYQLWNDLVGDCLSLTFGASASVCYSSALHDLSSYHLGLYEEEIFISLGKECTIGDTWSSRWWGMAGFRFSERGSPGIISRWAWEKNSSPYEWGLFIDLLGGLGSRRLHTHSFSGYGSVRYRAIDLGAKVRKYTECSAILEGEIRQRVWARNFPQGATLIQLSYIYPFGL